MLGTMCLLLCENLCYHNISEWPIVFQFNNIISRVVVLFVLLFAFGPKHMVPKILLSPLQAARLGSEEDLRGWRIISQKRIGWDGQWEGSLTGLEMTWSGLNAHCGSPKSFV